jgi:pimeloyl-ACP methyl ester carboxylesterase
MPTLSLEDCDLWYQETGAGPPMVCLHGGWQNGEVWQDQVEHFASEYRVVTVDTRGHGKTGATDRSRYTVDCFADDLEHLLASLDIDRPVLCGSSLGGMVVQTYLGRHPDQARGAVIGGPVRTFPPVELPRTTKALFTPMPALATSLAFTGPETTFRSLLGFIRSVTGGWWLSVDETVRSAAIDAVGEMDAAEFRKTFDALYRFEPPDLSHVRTPTLVVYGEHEVPMVKRQGHQIAELVDDGTVREIADAGHLLNQDQPAAFNSAVASFVDGLADRSPTA